MNIRRHLPLRAARWAAPAVLATALGLGAVAAPGPVRAQDSVSRVLVDVADVVLRGGHPYYRYGSYGANDRLTTGRDRYGRTVYYRVAGHAGPPYGNAYGYHRNGAGSDRDIKCNKHGKCKTTYYDPRYDQRSRMSRSGYYGDGRGFYERGRDGYDD